MKLIRAIIQPHRFDEVRDALQKAGVMGMTCSEVKGFGRQKGHKEIYRGAEYSVNFRPKISVDVVVEAGKADAVVEALIAAARTGQTGDGKIFVLDVTDAVRIRTGERGESAL